MLTSVEAASIVLPAVCRKLNMADGLEVDEISKPPTVYDLKEEVTRLQHLLGDDSCISGNDDASSFVENTVSQFRQNSYTNCGVSEKLSRRGICSGHKNSTNICKISPNKIIGAIARGKINNSVLKTPSPKRRETLTPAEFRKVPRPTRVAALTRANISLLPTPRAPNITGSVCGSQKSRTSIRTDGGAVFSRLYQPDFYKNREEKLRDMRAGRNNFDCTFTPLINRRGSISSRDSIGSGSQASMASAKTDVVNVSSRLYDPDYLRKRNARLQRMRYEREMRECTFVPAINANASTILRKKLQ